MRYMKLDYIAVPFGQSIQLARIEGFTLDGRYKVRGYNKSRREWMPNLRTLKDWQTNSATCGLDLARSAPQPPAYKA